MRRFQSKFTAPTALAGPRRSLQGLLRRLRRAEGGFTLVEGLLAMTLLIVVVAPMMLVLQASSSAQNRAQQWSLEIQDGASGVTKMMHEIRQAYNVIAPGPSSVEFDVVQNGVQEHVGYYCDVPQPGTAYYECVRVQASSVSATLPAPSSTPSANVWPVVLRVQNGATTTYCNGSAISDAVFHYANTANQNNSSTCSEVAQDQAALAPTLIQASVSVPARGELPTSQSAGLSHTTVLSSAAYMRNLNLLEGT
jgi:hypothetical protein